MNYTEAMSTESMHTGFDMRQQAESDLDTKPYYCTDQLLNDLAFECFPWDVRKCTDTFNGKCMQMAHEQDRHAHIDTMAAAIDFALVSCVQHA